ncbi:MAG: M64 family metallo-endopeptidase, partial [Candidatus Sumerlaeota bacterium]|nr:M64 family metallo-endopeptidase [Candidatus Sumerlaeota bacterium]
ARSSLAVCAATDLVEHWQLTFAYGAKGVRLLNARQIPALAKEVRTPDLCGAAFQMESELTWLGEKGEALSSLPVQIPLGLRSTVGSPVDSPTALSCEGVFVLRVAGPNGPGIPVAARLRGASPLARTDGGEASAVPPALQNLDLTFPVESAPAAQRLSAGPFSTAKVLDSGPDLNRLVFVVMGDGYTASELSQGLFARDVESAIGTFAKRSPWDVCLAGINVYRVDVESAEQGADDPHLEHFVNTYFDSSYWTNGIERLLALDSDGMLRAADLADRVAGPGVWDGIIVLVNADKYGGSGGFLTVSSMNAYTGDVVLHELGHSFGGLADEYESAATGAPYSDAEPNVDFDGAGPDLKWTAWVDADMPMPTPETQDYQGRVGAFEGAKGYSKGVYRPSLNCLMRNIGNDFCPVCQEALARRFFGLLSLVDSAWPAPDGLYQVNQEGLAFSATPLPISPVRCEWRLGRELIKDAKDPALTLTAREMSKETDTLELQISYPTSLIRSEAPSQTLRWNVARVGGAFRTAARPAVWQSYN